MKMTVYLPDDLHERVKAQPDLNVSAVCQQALSRELDRLGYLDRLDHGEWLDVTLDTAAGRVVFTGQLLATEDYSEYPAVYLTSRHRYAVVVAERGEEAVYDFDSLDEALKDLPVQVIADARRAVGDDTPIRLDI